MNEILSVVLASMHADLARVERAAMNLANAQTPAHKREVFAATPFATRLAAAGSTASADHAREAGGLTAVHLDQRAGTLRTTGQSLDLAIVGEGWFEIATAQGPAYTRQGNFRLDARGRLVTQQGLPVMGLGGEIQLPHGAPVIDAAGRVFDGQPSAGRQASTPIAQLKVVQFERAAPMQRLGDGLYAPSGGSLPAREGAVQVQQGMLENSNVSHMQEMVRLMESVRHFESLQKAVTGYDEMLAAGIRRLGEP